MHSGETANTLKLWETLKALHSIFHMSLLKKFIAGANGTILNVPTKLKQFPDDSTYKVENIGAECSSGKFNQYRVRWLEYSAECNSSIYKYDLKIGCLFLMY